MVFGQPTCFTLKQRNELRVSGCVQGVNAFIIGFNSGMSNGTLQTLKKSLKLIIISELVLSNQQGEFPSNNFPACDDYHCTLVFLQCL